MEIEERLLNPFTQAKYLSSENYKRYIPIINYLYKQHEVYYAPPSLPSEIYEYLKENNILGVFDDYTEKQLEDDLIALEEWGNVLSHRDNSNVNRLEDFKNRKLRYQCSQGTIDLERYMQELDNRIQKIQSSLDPKVVGSLSSLVLKLNNFINRKEITNENRLDLGQLWETLFENFKKLRQESSDYLGVIHSKNMDDALQNKQITAFRSKFTEYLTSFIISLQENINPISVSIREIDRKGIENIFAELIKLQKDKPSLDEELHDDEYREIFLNQWNGIKKWFIKDQFNERYIDYLLRQTDETISRFMKYLQQMSERDQRIKSRKKDFEYIAKLFKREECFELCQRSFAALTNVEKPRHFASLNVRKPNPESSLFDLEPEMKSLKKAVERPSKRKKALAAVERTKEDLEEIKRIQREKEEQEQKIANLVKREVVRLKTLENVEPFIRETLLHWIGLVINRKNKKGKTDQGITFTLDKASDEFVDMKCQDGVLSMPDYVLYFEVKS